MNNKVYIQESKSGKTCKVIDVKTGKPWANETFRGYSAVGEARQFCNDNNLVLVANPKTAVKIIEAKVEIEDVAIEDGGQAQIAMLSDNEETGVFVALHSWDESREHSEFHKFIGRKVRITIETID